MFTKTELRNFIKVYMLCLICLCSFFRSSLFRIRFEPLDNPYQVFNFHTAETIIINKVEARINAEILQKIKTVYEQERYYRVPFGLLIKIAEVESNFNPYAKSMQENKIYYDLGLFQINEQYLDFFKIKYNLPENFDAFCVEHATMFAIRHLNFLLTYFNEDYVKAVSAYNAGITRINNKQYPDITICYVNKILSRQGL